MTVLMAHVEVRKEKRNEFLEIMQRLIERAQKEERCKRFEFFPHKTPEHTYSFYIVWNSYQEFKQYVRSDDFSLMLTAFKLLNKNPEIQYFKNHSGTGLYGLLRLRENNININ